MISKINIVPAVCELSDDEDSCEDSSDDVEDMRDSEDDHGSSTQAKASTTVCVDLVSPQRPTKATEASNKRKASPNKSSSHAEEGILTIESEDASSENDSVKSMKVPWTKRGEAKSHAMLNRALQKKEKTSTKVAKTCSPHLHFSVRQLWPYPNKLILSVDEIHPIGKCRNSSIPMAATINMG